MVKVRTEPRDDSDDADQEETPAAPEPRRFAKLPDNFGGIGAEADLSDNEVDRAEQALAEDIAAEPEPEGYVRPLTVGPTRDAPETEARPIGQSVSRAGSVSQPQPLRHYTPEQLGQQIVTKPDDGLAPLDRNLVCPVCGSNVGAFIRDPFSGTVRHQGCSPNVRNQGVQPPRAVPFVPVQDWPREFSTADAKTGMIPPEEV